MRQLMLVPLAALAAVTLSACTSATTPAGAPSAAPSTSAPADTMSPSMSASGTPSPSAPAAAPAFASGKLADPSGSSRGTVEFAEVDGGVQVRVQATGLEPGFHGLHVHAIGKCEPNSPDPQDASKRGDFNSAGGHLAGDGSAHPDHAGDLPALYVAEDGTASLTAVTDRLTRDLLLDTDGSALIVHSGSDNFANIPTRYASAGPDDETTKAGDAGKRVACAPLAP